MMAKEFKNSSRQWKIQLGIIRCGQVPLIRKWTVQWRYSGWIIHLHLVYYDFHKNLIISFYFILDKVTKQKGKNLVQLKLNKGNVAYTAKVYAFYWAKIFSGFGEVCHDKIVLPHFFFFSRRCKDWPWSLSENSLVADFLEAWASGYSTSSTQWNFMAGKLAAFLLNFGTLSH